MSCIKFPGSKSHNDSKNSPDTETDHVYKQLIKVANDVFGNGKWSHSVTSQNLDFIEFVNGKYHAGCVSIVRVQLLDGQFHEDMGYCTTEGPTKGKTIYNVRSVSVTNALRKALSCFGNSFIAAIEKMVEANYMTPKIQPHHKVDIPRLTDLPVSQTDKFLEDLDFNETTFEKKESTFMVESKKLDSSAKSSSKPTNSSAMTEEEIRAERKRKQRELQEEFKKKYQTNNNSMDSKAPNPRF